MLVWMILTLMQGHSGSAKAKNHPCMLSATNQAISIKLATTVSHFCLTLTLTLQTFILLIHLVSFCVQTAFKDIDFLTYWVALCQSIGASLKLLCNHKIVLSVGRSDSPNLDSFEQHNFWTTGRLKGYLAFLLLLLLCYNSNEYLLKLIWFCWPPTTMLDDA